MPSKLLLPLAFIKGVRQNGKPTCLQQLPKDEASDKNGAFAFARWLVGQRDENISRHFWVPRFNFQTRTEATRKDFAKYVLQMLKRQEPMIN